MGSKSEVSLSRHFTPRPPPMHCPIVTSPRETFAFSFFRDMNCGVFFSASAWILFWSTPTMPSDEKDLRPASCNATRRVGRDNMAQETRAGLEVLTVCGLEGL